MQPMDFNAGLYPLSVSTSSVGITLSASDIRAANPTASGYNLVVTNTGPNPVFGVAGIGSSPTAVYPVSGTKTTGTLLLPGSVTTWKVTPGTTHLSFIAAAGTNLIAVKVGQGE